VIPTSPRKRRRIPDAPEIDRVEWSAGASGDIVVEVHARPGTAVPTTAPELVAEPGPGEQSFSSAGRWPPSLRGGAWSVSFVLPLAWRGALGGELGLRAEGVLVALPAATALPAAPAASAGKVIDSTVLAERRARRAELSEESLSRRVGEAEALVHQLQAQLGHLERQLRDALGERARMSGELAGRERELRVMRQREYSEQQLRIEAEAEIERVRRETRAGLERDLVSLDQALEAERRERAGAEAALVEGEVRQADELRRARRQIDALRAELQERQRIHDHLRVGLGLLRDELGEPSGCEPQEDPPGERLGLRRRAGAASAMRRPFPEEPSAPALIEHLGEAARRLQERVPAGGHRPEPTEAEAQALATTTATEPGRGPRKAPPPRVAVSPPVPGGDGWRGGAGAPGAAAGAWLWEATARMARAGGAERAGRLIVELLAVQGLRYPRELRYLLRIDELRPLVVTITHGDVHTGPVDPASGDPEIAFRLGGPAVALAPLGAGATRRRLPGVDVGGRRRELRRLLKAMRAPVTLEELAEGRVTPSPELVLEAVALGVDPAWTAGHSFDVAYVLVGGAGPTALRVQVRDGEPLTVGPHDGAAAATVTTTREGLVAMLARRAGPGAGVEMSGSSTALAMLGRWLERAQGRAGIER